MERRRVPPSHVGVAALLGADSAEARDDAVSRAPGTEYARKAGLTRWRGGRRRTMPPHVNNATIAAGCPGRR